MFQSYPDQIILSFFPLPIVPQSLYSLPHHNLVSLSALFVPLIMKNENLIPEYSYDYFFELLMDYKDYNCVILI